MPSARAKSRPVAVITGGASNIGAAVAERFRTTYTVLIADIKQPSGVLSELPFVHADVAVHADCTRVFEEAAKLGDVSAVIHSAGITAPADVIVDIEPETWERVLRVNLTGTFNVVQAAARALTPAKGSAVLIASRAGKTGVAALNYTGSTKAHYSASKAGVISLVKSLALELAPRGIRVNGVAPGSIEGAMIPRERWPELAGKIPLGRLGRPAEIAGACFFLSSAEASYITGHILDVNGGTLMD